MRIFISDFTLTWQADKWWRGCIYSARPQVTSARRCPAFTIWYAGQTHPLQHFTSRPVISGYFISGFYCIYRQSLDKSWQIKWWNPENFRHTLSLSLSAAKPKNAKGSRILEEEEEAMTSVWDLVWGSRESHGSIDYNVILLCWRRGQNINCRGLLLDLKSSL